jgi:hypothetical protein
MFTKIADKGILFWSIAELNYRKHRMYMC